MFYRGKGIFIGMRLICLSSGKIVSSFEYEYFQIWIYRVANSVNIKEAFSINQPSQAVPLFQRERAINLGTPNLPDLFCRIELR